MDDEMPIGKSDVLARDGFSYFQHWQYFPRDITAEICKLVGRDAKHVMRQVSKGMRDAVDNGVRCFLIHDARVIKTMNAVGRFPYLWEIRFLQSELLNLSDLPKQVTHVDASECKTISTDVLCTLAKSSLISLSLSRKDDQNALLLNGLVLSSKASLKALTLSNCCLSDGEVKCLTAFEALSILSLPNCWINAANALSLAKIRGLQELNLRSRSPIIICNEINYIGIAALLENASLTSLDVSGIALSKKGDATVFCNALAANQSITRLRIDGNGLEDDIASGLSRSTTLLSLSIARNCLTDAGLKCIASMKTLTDLDASTNDIGVDGGLALFDNVTIKRLCLNGNAVSSDVVKVFVEMRALTSLSLRGCKLSEEALEHLWRSQSLLVLDIGSNFSRERVTKLLAHPSLRRLSIGHKPTLRAVDVMALKKNGLISDRMTLEFDYAHVDTILDSKTLKAIAGADNFSYIDSLRIGGEGFVGGNLSLLPSGLKALHLTSLGRLVESDLRPLLKQSQLARIKVEGTEVDDAGLALLASLKSLQHLEFSAVRIGASGRQIIDQHRGQAVVEFGNDGLWHSFRTQVNDFLGW